MVADEVQKRMNFLAAQINTIMKVTKDEYDDRQKIEHAKKFILRKKKYPNALIMPETEREELRLKVKEELKKDREKSVDTKPTSLTHRTVH